MTSNETLMIKQRFLNEHLPRLKPLDENGIINKRLLQKQPKLRSSSIIPPIPQNIAAGTTMTNSPVGSSITHNSTFREAVRYSIIRNNLPSLSPRSSFLQISHNALPRRSTRYDHIPSRIYTGLPRIDNMARTDGDTYQLGPTHPIDWQLLKQELEQDTQIRAQAKRIHFNSGVTYMTQLTTLSDLIRSKVKAHVSSIMGFGKERYKIVVQLNAFQKTFSGLHIASRCLWNILTDNSITIKMQGVDCDLLIIVFLCYTDLGAA
jgi:hypothetical protein